MRFKSLRDRTSKTYLVHNPGHFLPFSIDTHVVARIHIRNALPPRVSQTSSPFAVAVDLKGHLGPFLVNHFENEAQLD